MEGGVAEGCVVMVGATIDAHTKRERTQTAQTPIVSNVARTATHTGPTVGSSSPIAPRVVSAAPLCAYRVFIFLPSFYRL